jgi:hypothetical protein
MLDRITGGGNVKLKVRVRNDEGEWFNHERVRAVLCDDDDRPEIVIGRTGMQYREFKLEVEGE